MGLANWLTVLRILLIPVFVSLLVYRQRGSQSRLGAFLDPMADKLLLVSSFVTLTWLRVLPFWIAAVVISRDLILVVGALAIHMAGGRITPRPSAAGKLATFFQVLTVLGGLLGPFYNRSGGAKVVMWLAVTFTVVSGLHYIVQGMGFLNAGHAEENREPDETALFR